MSENSAKRVEEEVELHVDTGGKINECDSDAERLRLLYEALAGERGATVTDASIGAYEVTIQPDDTNSVVNGGRETLFHKVEYVDSSGEKSILMKGDITVQAA